jgi:CubicO group peptidase (beta-lactamase class C family)
VTRLGAAATNATASVLRFGSTVAAVGVADGRDTLVDVVDSLPDAEPPGAVPVFDIGSVTKVVATAPLCMRLDLDTPVSRWFTGLPGSVRDLLEHRAGLWEWWPLYLSGAADPQSALAALTDLPCRYPLRSGRHYSDLGFMLLGAIVENEYDERLDAVAEREVFSALGMTDTGFRPGVACVPTSLGDRIERGMVETGAPYPVTPATPPHAFAWRGHRLAGEANDGNCWHAFGGVAGHAGLFTTVPDLIRFGQALLASLSGSGPWPRAAEFCAPGRDPAQGLGFRVSGGRVEHPGFPGARFAVLPHLDRVVVLLCNRLFGSGEPATLDEEWAQLLSAVELSAQEETR